MQDIREHMEVVGSDGQHVGTVDHVDGDHIKLTKSDRAANGKHHLIPMAWVEAVDAKVHLQQAAREAMTKWQTAA